MHSQKRQIALLHACREDISLLNTLLIDEPFDVVPHKDVHSIADQKFKAEIDTNVMLDTFGVVVCARDTTTNSSATANPSAEDLVAYDLGQLNGRYQRVVVLADSMDETRVCSYLGAGAHHVIALNDPPRLIQARLIAGLRQHSEPIQMEWHIGPYHFDLSRRTVAMNDKNIRLSPREFEFARYLFERRGQVVPTDEILLSVWSLPAHTDTRRIDTAACRLRKKMSLGQGDQWQLKRLRGRGYQLVRRSDGH